MTSSNLGSIRTDRGAIRIERRVVASPAAVYAYLTDPAKWARWQGASAEIDAVPGGLFRMTMPNGVLAEGRFVDLVPDQRVLFTWGWHGSTSLPPGSSTVEIDLIRDGEATLIRLTHDDLPLDEHDAHRAGWRHYLPRLASVAEGRDAGADPGPGAGG